MIKEFTDRFMSKKDRIAGMLSQHPSDYIDLVKIVIDLIADDSDYSTPDKDRITEIDNGDYQGTLVYVIAEKGYQPNQYWYVKVEYGSCSVCDTLLAIRDSSGDIPTKADIKDYTTLCLHIVQGIKKM